MPAGSCERCREAGAVARLRPGDQPPIALCESCLHLALPQRGGSQLDLARFFLLLTRPRPIEAALEIAPMRAETACARCGLTYEDFAEHGFAGCPECYTEFEPAILPALRQLHG